MPFDFASAPSWHPGRAQETWGAASRRLARMVALKAGITAALAAWLGAKLVPGDPLSVAFLSVICLQATPQAGWRLGLSQLGAALLGGALGLVFYHLLGPLGLGPAVALAAWPAFRRQDPSLLAGAAFSALYLPLMPPPHDFGLLVQRMAAVGVGIGVAQLMNALGMALLHPLDVAARRERAVKAVIPAWQALSRALNRESPQEAAQAVAGRAMAFQALGAAEGALHDLGRGLNPAAVLALGRVQALLVAHERAVALGSAASLAMGQGPVGPPRLAWPTLASEAVDAGVAVAEAMALPEPLQAQEVERLTAWRERLRAVDVAWPPPMDPSERLGPGLAMLVATQGLIEALLEQAERERALALVGPEASPA